MEETENSGAKQRGPSQPGSTEPMSSITFQSFICKLTKFWAFSMMLHMERENWVGRSLFSSKTQGIKVAERNWWHQGREEQRWLFKSRGGRLQATQRSKTKGFPCKKGTDPPTRELTWSWHGTRPCTKSQGKEQSLGIQTASDLIQVPSPSVIPSG